MGPQHHGMGVGDGHGLGPWHSSGSGLHFIWRKGDKKLSGLLLEGCTGVSLHQRCCVCPCASPSSMSVSRPHGAGGPALLPSECDLAPACLEE